MSEQESKPAAGPSDTPGSSPSKSAKPAATGKNKSKANSPQRPNQPGTETGKAKPPAAPGKAPAASEPARRGGRAGFWLALLALLVAALAVAAGAYLWQQQQLLRKQVQSQQSALDSTASSLRADWSGRAERLQSQADQQAQGQQELRQAVESVREVAGRSRRDWILAEVEYLLRIANRRLQLQRDVGTAIAALQSADQRLRELADPGLTGVRERITRELDALRATPRPDLEGMALQLASLSEQVPQLPVKAARAPARTQPTVPESDQSPLSVQQWRQGLARAWEALKSLVVIRRRDEPIAPLLGPAQEFAVREGLRLQLEGARVALLRQDPALYESSLQGARDWMAQYFVADDARYRAMAQILEELGGRRIRVELPDISASLRSLREVMRERDLATDRQPAAPAAPEDAAQEPGAPAAETAPAEETAPQPAAEPQAPAADVPAPAGSAEETQAPGATAEQPEAVQ